MALTKIGTDIIAAGAITADKIAAGALDTQLAGYLSTNSFATVIYENFIEKAALRYHSEHAHSNSSYKCC